MRVLIQIFVYGACVQDTDTSKQSRLRSPPPPAHSLLNYFALEASFSRSLNHKAPSNGMRGELCTEKERERDTAKHCCQGKTAATQP